MASSDGNAAVVHINQIAGALIWLSCSSPPTPSLSLFLSLEAVLQIAVTSNFLNSKQRQQQQQKQQLISFLGGRRGVGEMFDYQA